MNISFYDEDSTPFYLSDVFSYLKYIKFTNTEFLYFVFNIQFSESIINAFNYNLIKDVFHNIENYIRRFKQESDENGFSRFKEEDFTEDNNTLIFWLNLFLDEDYGISYFDNIFDIFQLFYKNPRFQSTLNDYNTLNRDFELKLEKYGPKGIIKYIYETSPDWISKIIKLSIISKIFDKYIKINKITSIQSIFESINTRLKIINNLEILNLREEECKQILNHFSGLFNQLLHNYKYYFLYTEYLEPILEEFEEIIYNQEESYFQSIYPKIKIINYNVKDLEADQIDEILKKWLDKNYNQKVTIFKQDLIDFCVYINLILHNLSSTCQFSSTFKKLVLKKISQFREIPYIQKRFKGNFQFIENYIEFFSLEKEIKESKYECFNSYNEWTNFIKIYFQFEEITHIIITFVNTIEKTQIQVENIKNKTRAKYERLKTDINDYYARWFLSQYEEWLRILIPNRLGNRMIQSSRLADLPILTPTFLNSDMIQIKLTKKNDIFFIIVFDCLRYDFSDIIRDIFKNDYDVISDDIGFSAIPSATYWSRRAIFAGSFRNQYRWENDESKLFCENFHLTPVRNNPNVKYTLMEDENSIQECISNIKKYNIITINWSDTIIHENKALFTSNLRKMKSEFSKKFHELFSFLLEKFSEFENHKVLICSDHGWIQIPNANNIRIEQSHFKQPSYGPLHLKLDIHGRYFFSSAELKNDDDFWVVPKNSLEKFGFPKGLRPFDELIYKGEYYCYILKKLKYFKIRRSKKVFMHGGISIDETILPFITYNYNRKQLPKFSKNNIEISIENQTNLVLNKAEPYILLDLFFNNLSNTSIELSKCYIIHKERNVILYHFQENLNIEPGKYFKKKIKIYQEIKEDGSKKRLPLKFSSLLEYRDENNQINKKDYSTNFKLLNIFDFAKPKFEFLDFIGKFSYVYGFKNIGSYFIKNNQEPPKKHEKIEIRFNIINLNQKRIIIEDINAIAINTQNEPLVEENVHIRPEGYERGAIMRIDERDHEKNKMENLKLIFKPQNSGIYKIIFSFKLSMYPLTNEKIELEKRLIIYNMDDFKSEIKKWK